MKCRRAHHHLVKWLEVIPISVVHGAGDIHIMLQRNIAQHVGGEGVVDFDDIRG